MRFIVLRESTRNRRVAEELRGLPSLVVGRNLILSLLTGTAACVILASAVLQT